jgi:hypothetical protein
MKRFLVYLIIIALVSMCLLSPTQEATAQSNTTTLGGPTSHISMHSDTNLLFSSGGGHIEWTISGPITVQMRSLMDTTPHDGNITLYEAERYIGNLDSWIESHYIQYHGAKILRCSLMNHQITTDTHGIIGEVSSPSDIGINFIYDVAPVTDKGTYEMSDPVFVQALFATFDNSNMTYLYSGEVELRHINTVVGLESFQHTQVPSGKVTHYVLPLVDYYDYSIKYSNSAYPPVQKEDWGQYEVFDPLSNSLVILVILIIMWVIMVSVPKWFASYYNKKPVFGLRGGLFGLLALEFIFYVLAWRYLVLYILGALFVVLSCVLSYYVYVRSKLAKDLKAEPEVRPVEPKAEEKPLQPELSTIIEDIFLIYRDGRLIAHHTRKLKPDMDDDILSGMLTAVQEFIKTSFGGDEASPVSEITYGKNKILIEHGQFIFISAVIEGQGSEEMHERMRSAVHNIELEFDKELTNWSGDVKDLKDAKRWLKAVITGRPIEEVSVPGQDTRPKVG